MKKIIFSVLAICCMANLFYSCKSKSEEPAPAVFDIVGNWETAPIGDQIQESTRLRFSEDPNIMKIGTTYYSSGCSNTIYESVSYSWVKEEDIITVSIQGSSYSMIYTVTSPTTIRDDEGTTFTKK